MRLDRAPVRHRLRKYVANFADQIYSVQALAFAAIADNHGAARDAADRAAARLVELQGPLGQWWWHYNPRSGDVAQSFPVYAVHQHAMAPMALMAAAAAGGTDQRDAVTLSHRWIKHNQTRRGSARSAHRHDLARHRAARERARARLATHSRSLLGMAEADLDKRRARLTVNRETRRYEVPGVSMPAPSPLASHGNLMSSEFHSHAAAVAFPQERILRPDPAAATRVLRRARQPRHRHGVPVRFRDLRSGGRSCDRLVSPCHLGQDGGDDECGAAGVHAQGRGAGRRLPCGRPDRSGWCAGGLGIEPGQEALDGPRGGLRPDAGPARSRWPRRPARVFPGCARKRGGRAARRCAHDYPGLQVAGYRNGYFTDSDVADVVAQVRHSSADIVFIGMPSPFKEIFAERHRDDFNAPVIMGVGGSFDVLAGFVKRAPASWQKVGMEWSWRLLDGAAQTLAPLPGHQYAVPRPRRPRHGQEPLLAPGIRDRRR